MSYQTNYQQQSQQNTPAVRPDSYLAWAILCTCLCCMPLGIVSIIYASKVDSYWVMGDYQSAIEASNKAKKWAIWGAVGAAIYVVVILVLYAVLFGIGLLSSAENIF